MKEELLYDSTFKNNFVTFNAKLFKEESRKAIKKAYDKMLISERDYDWYFTQNDTGGSSNVNCGVAVIAMITKWADANSTSTVESIREEFIKEGITGGIRVSQLLNSISKYVDVRYITSDVPLYMSPKRMNILVVDASYTTGKEPCGKLHTVILNSYFRYNGTKYITIYDPAASKKKAISRFSSGNDVDTETVEKYKNYSMYELDYFRPYVKETLALTLKDK